MHQLKSFTPDSSVGVRADIARVDSGLRFYFATQNFVTGGPTPGQWSSWERGDELWRTTCFEAFLRRPNQVGYWELNLSPAQRRWNMYHFTNYREPMPPTPVADFTLSQIEMTNDSLQCELRGPAKWPGLEVNLCAVIQIQDNEYFALTHPGPKPDFHSPKGFTLKLPPGGA